MREKYNAVTQTNYTREVADTICARMAEGESLRSICRTPGIPSEGTVRGWAVRDVDGFSDRYRAARSLLVEYWADQILDIADEPELDPRDRQIRVHTRQWLMSKLAPRRFGGLRDRDVLRIMDCQFGFGTSLQKRCGSSSRPSPRWVRLTRCPTCFAVRGIAAVAEPQRVAGNRRLRATGYSR